MRTFVIAKTLVYNERNQVLALRRSETDERRPGQWDFPGGRVDPGETPDIAAVRETSEEAGIDIADPKLVYGTSAQTEYGAGTWLLYVAKVKALPPVTLSHEHGEYAWLAPHEFLARITYDRQRHMLRYVIKHRLLS